MICAVFSHLVSCRVTNLSRPNVLFNYNPIQHFSSTLFKPKYTHFIQLQACCLNILLIPSNTVCLSPASKAKRALTLTVS